MIDGITDSMDMPLSKLQREIMKDRVSLCAAVHGVTQVGHNWVAEQHQDLPRRKMHVGVFLRSVSWRS